MAPDVEPPSTDGLSRPGRPTAIAVGNFDGVHRGHQALARTAAACARDRNLETVVLTFHPHPFEVLGGPGRAVLTPLSRKVELLGRIDPALTVVVEPFTRELASLTPREFAERVLVSKLHAHTVVVGHGFRFGKGRAGDLATLQELGQTFGFSALSAELVTDDGSAISSSRIRAAIEQGDVGGAERMLSRPHALSGRVVHGDGRGRVLGVPTANLSRVQELLPPHGVYACLVDRAEPGGAPNALGGGVLNVGVRPTVEAGFSLEVHVLDFAADLYGAYLRVHLLERLREERRFAGTEELTAQIQRDIAAARRIHAELRPDPSLGGAWR
jgi:riboflavin kinase / FMN adenylyltransferase